MASTTILDQLAELAETQAQALELTENFYSLQRAAEILQISRAKLDKYLHDPEYQLNVLQFENDRKHYILAEDIRRLYGVLHRPFFRKRPGYSVPPRPTPAR